MKKTPSLFLSILVFFIAHVNAQDITYEEYLIKKGDTLWDISDSKLNNPFLWPKLWKGNPYIKNPDLIYPGDRIRIPKAETIMPIDKSHEETKIAEEPAKKEFPQIPSTSEQEKIVERKQAAERSQDTKRFIVDRATYIASGWISQGFSGIGEIVASTDNHSIFGKDDIVFLKTDNNLKLGDKFFVVRNVKKVIHPKTNVLLGHLIKIQGIVEVFSIDSGILKAKITDTFEEIRIGDRLLPYTEIEIPYMPDIIRSPDIRGYIVESFRGSMLVSTGDIVYLDKGNDNGLMIGDTFDIFVDAHCFRILVGTLQIIALQPQTSTAIIVKSIQEITIGDMWEN